MKFYKSIKFKALAGALLLIIILCAAFIRIIPDYSTSRGFAVVSLPDYNKYKQGYCLKEDRILPKEELYKRAIGQYLDKELLVQQGIKRIVCAPFRKCRGIEEKIKNLKYYIVEDFNNSNWYEYLIEKYDRDKKYFDVIRMREINPIDYLIVDLKSNTAGFKKPIIYNDRETYSLFLDKGFLLSADIVSLNYIYLTEYKDALKLDDYDKNMYHINIKNSDSPKGWFKLDNCGNTDYNVEQASRMGAESILQGG